MPAAARLQDGRVVAFLDIGTNAVRLLLARLHPGGAYVVLRRQREPTRLGEDEFKNRRLHRRAMERALQVCGRFAAVARHHRAAEIVAVATAACRDARNGGEFLRRLRQEAGVEARVISGREEARLVHLGAASGLNLRGRRALFIDIGGGSTELAVGDERRQYYLDTLKLGAARLAQRFSRRDDARPVSERGYQRLRDHAKAVAVRALQQLRRQRFELAVGSSGTISSLAAVAALLPPAAPASGAGRLERSRLATAVALLRRTSLAQRRRVPGLNPERADIILPGAAILETVLDELGLDEILVSERNLREGLLVDYLHRSDRAAGRVSPSLRERSVRQLGRTCGFDEGHARHVARLALEVFDSARAAGLHDQGPAERELLSYAALLHDVGRFLSFSGHQEHSAYFICHADLLGFDQREIDIMSAAVLFHRKLLPRKRRPPLRDLDPPARATVRLLALCLRLAESLDRGHARAVRHARFRPAANGRGILEVTTSGNWQLEKWALDSDRRAIRKLLGRDFLVAEAGHERD